jgi:hypothetical protein
MDGVIRNIAKEKGIVPQALLQNYMLERHIYFEKRRADSGR